MECNNSMINESHHTKHVGSDVHDIIPISFPKDPTIPLLLNQRDELAKGNVKLNSESSFPFLLLSQLSERSLEKASEGFFSANNNYSENSDDDERNDSENSIAINYSKKGSSFFQAMFNGLNVLAGIGILSTPYALSQGGWLSLCILFIFSIVCCYTGILLKNCLETRQDMQLTGYPDIGKLAFGIAGKYIISTFLFLELYAVTIELLVLEGDNLSHLFPNIQFKLFHFHLDSQKTFMVIFAILILPTVWIRHLHVLSYVSVGGVFASFLVVFCVWWVGEMDGVGFRSKGSLIQINGFPAAIGLFGFCFSGHAVFPTIYASMNKPQLFSKVLILCFVICTFLYGSVAVMGYCMYGNELQTQITLNLPHKYLASKIAIWTTIINPFTKFAITLSPIVLAIEEIMLYDSGGINFIMFSTILRTALVVTSLLIALAFPYFEYVMAFIGSFLSISLSVIFPCVCYVRIVKETSVTNFVFCFLCSIFGLVSVVIGTFYAIRGITIDSMI